MLRTNTEDIRSFVKENDIFVVDRGFRDSISMLEDLGLRAEMPCFMTKGAKQMPTEDANSSRLVTKVLFLLTKRYTCLRGFSPVWTIISQDM